GALRRVHAPAGAALIRARRVAADNARPDSSPPPAAGHPPAHLRRIVPALKAGGNGQNLSRSSTDRAGCPSGAPNPARRPAGPDLLRGYARPRRPRVLGRLN